MTEHEIVQAMKIKVSLNNGWQFFTEDDRPTQQTLLACGLVLSQMKAMAETTGCPLFKQEQMTVFVNNALAYHGCEQIDRRQFVKDFLKIAQMFKLAHPLQVSTCVLLDDNFFMNLWVGAPFPFH